MISKISCVKKILKCSNGFVLLIQWPNSCNGKVLNCISYLVFCLFFVIREIFKSFLTGLSNYIGVSSRHSYE